MQPQAQFDRILSICKLFSPLAFNSQGNLPHPGPIPACSDIEIIALSLFQSLLSIESECRFFSTLRFLLPGFSVKLSRRNFNSRRRRLTQFIEIIRKRLSQFLCANTGDSLLIIDSMPIETCRYSRASSSRIFKENEDSAPSYGYCAAQQQLYWGYKFHCVCTAAGVIVRYDLSPAHHHDIKYLQDIQDEVSNCVLVGDKGYRSNPLRLTLFEYAGIELATPCRKNELLQHTMPDDYQRIRKRVEVVFSQLVDQFAIRKNYAKSQIGLFTRIISKVTLFTMLQYINLMNNQPLNQIRYTLSA